MRFYLITALFLASVAYLGYFPEQSDFHALVIGYIVAFAAVIVLYLKPLRFTSSQITYWLVVGFLARMILLPAFPQLSDDIYRFYWDGLLTLDGVNPYHFTPSDYIASGADTSWAAQLYPQLNSPDYYSVYPPLNQLLFAAAAWLSSSVATFSLLLKLLILAAEGVTCYYGIKILGLLGQRRERIFLYLLNPLIIIELSGNVHFEAFVVAAVSAGLYYLLKQDMVRSAIGWALAVGTKLTPLLLLPALWRKPSGKQGIAVLWGVSAVVVALLLSPIVWSLQSVNFGESLDLYFRTFEFNASLYYIARWIGQGIVGYNLIAYIGPLLAVFTIIIIGLNSWYAKKELSAYRFISLLLWLYVIYLFLSTTVHPWYLSLPIFLTLFTRFRFPLLWSLLIVLSYSHYQHGAYQEHYGLIALEYIIVFGAFLWEWLRDCSVVPWLMDEDPAAMAKNV